MCVGTYATRHTCIRNQIWQQAPYPEEPIYQDFFAKVHYVAQAGLKPLIILLELPKNTGIISMCHPRFSTFLLIVILGSIYDLRVPIHLYTSFSG